MIECSEVERMISMRLDGELPADLSGALDAHIESCSGCRELARRAEEVSGRLRQALAVGGEVGDLGSTIARAVAARPASRPPFVPGRWVQIAAAAASVVLGFGLWVILFGPARWVSPERSVVTPAPAGADEAVLCFETESEDSRVVPGLDGPPMRLRTQRRKTVLTDVVPGKEGGESRGELILELEREQNLRYAGNTWY